MGGLPDDLKLGQFRTMWADELAGAQLYRALAEHTDEKRRSVFLSLAEAEEHHASFWAAKLRAAGVELERPPTPFRVRVLSRLAAIFGSNAVLPLVLRGEAADADRYRSFADAPTEMADQEAAHGQVVAAMRGGDTVGGRIAFRERRHRTAAGGALRAAVFGVSDGLVSNLSLIMGVAGGSSGGRAVLIAGVAGLVAGACSMGSGEWISVRSQVELYENELRTEREELAAFPAQERRELELIYQAKGIDPEEAKSLAESIMSRPDVALETMAREELGLDPGELGSPWVAAGSSFASFTVGAIIPLVPFVFGSGAIAVTVSAVLSGIALFLVGAMISVVTGRGPVRTGLRMLLIGGSVALVTFLIGTAVGAAV